MTIHEWFDPVEQNRACRSLLAMVVWSAVHDACAAPLPPAPDQKSRSRKKLRISTHAFTAMRFLFDDSVSGLREYSAWLDFDPDQFREQLLRLMRDTTPGSVRGFPEMSRLHFLRNYNLWFEIPSGEEPPHSEEEEDND